MNKKLGYKINGQWHGFLYEGTATLKDGTEIGFSCTREEMEQYINDHSAKPVKSKDDGELVANYVQIRNRVHSKQKADEKASKPKGPLGGPRPGSGPKPKSPDGGSYHFAMRTTKELLEYIEQQGKLYGGKTAFVENAIKFWKNHH